MANSLLWVVAMVLGFFSSASCNIESARPRPYVEPAYGYTRGRILAQAGHPVRLSCLVYNLGPRTVFWFKQGQASPISIGSMIFTPRPDMSVEVRTENNEYWTEIRFDLIIENPSAADAGEYFCRIQRRYREDRSPITRLIISETPGVRIRSTMTAMVGNILELQCIATPGFPSPMRWFKDNQQIFPVGSEDRIVEINQEADGGSGAQSTLSISSALRSDSGTYVCRAYNAVERSIVESDIQVDVQPRGNFGERLWPRRHLEDMIVSGS